MSADSTPENNQEEHSNEVIESNISEPSPRFFTASRVELTKILLIAIGIVMVAAIIFSAGSRIAKAEEQAYGNVHHEFIYESANDKNLSHEIATNESFITNIGKHVKIDEPPTEPLLDNYTDISKIRGGWGEKIEYFAPTATSYRNNHEQYDAKILEKYHETKIKQVYKATNEYCLFTSLFAKYDNPSTEFLKYVKEYQEHGYTSEVSFRGKYNVPESLKTVPLDSSLIGFEINGSLKDRSDRINDYCLVESQDEEKMSDLYKTIVATDWRLR